MSNGDPQSIAASMVAKGWQTERSDSMTLRDELALVALKLLFKDDDAWDAAAILERGEPGSYFTDVGKVAYMMADAMLAARVSK